MPTAPTNLPTNLDSTYADTADASVKLHQVYHDTIHGKLNALEDDFASSSAARPGNFVVFLGDSITVGGDDVANNARRDSWPNYAAMFSGQVIRYVYNAGLPGASAASCLARFGSDVTPYNPTCVILQVGTSDVLSVDFPSWQTAVQNLVSEIRKIGAVPVLCTVPPVGATALVSAPYRNQLTSMFNLWLRQYSSRASIFLIDFFEMLTDPATGGMKAAYDTGDGIHPTSAAYKDMGQYASDLLTPRMAPNRPPITQADGDENNLVYKGCFTGYTGSTLPTSWADGAGIPAGSVLSYVTDSLVDGQMVQLTHTAVSAGVRSLERYTNLITATLASAASAGATTITITGTTQPINRPVVFIGSGSGFEVARQTTSGGSSGAWTLTLERGLRYAHSAGEQVIINGTDGDRLLLTGIVTTDGGVPVTAGFVNANLANAMYDMASGQVITRGTFAVETTIPAATALTRVRLQAGIGTGVVQFGQVSLYNLTRLGLPL